MTTKTIPLTQVRERLGEIVEAARDDQVWVITRHGQPCVAMVDVAYLNRLLDHTPGVELGTGYELAQASLGRVWDHPDEDLYTLDDGCPL